METEVDMTTIERELIVQNDGELFLSHLPCRKGDVVIAKLVITNDAPAKSREAALAEFLRLARSSAFRSEGSLPRREELHERS
jgi:hypothetical protein